MQMPNLEQAALRVGVISHSSHERRCLQQILEANGLQVVVPEALQDDAGPDPDLRMDVLLINLDESGEQDELWIDALVERTEVPILFNESATIRTLDTVAGKAWGRRLTAKLVELAAQAKARTHTQDDMDSGPAPMHGQRPVDVIVYEAADRQGRPDLIQALRVVALGASIGGPEALKQFLAVIPPGFPVAFVLAQHIGSGFVELLAAQLGRACSLEVVSASEGEMLRGGQLAIAPVEFHLAFDGQGVLKFERASGHTIYSPSIDSLMTEVAACYGADANAIVFSGMGNDGLKGCRDIVRAGGSVWAQSADSCVISSMADAVRDEGLVDFSGTPEQLGEHLVAYIDGLRI